MSRIRTGPQGPGGSTRTGQGRTEKPERPSPGSATRTDDRSAFEATRSARGPALLPPPHAGGPSSLQGIPGQSELRAIAAVPDAGARNRAMVQTWTQLSEGLARHLGRQDATWPTFEGWAGAALGSVTRAEEPVGPELGAQREEIVLNALEEVNATLEASGRKPLAARELDAALSATWSGVQQLLDGAHRDMFANLTPRLTGLIEALGRGVELAERYVDALPAEAPMLREAFSSYVQAARAEGPLRSELILLGNDQLGLHQQTLLQGADARLGALDAKGAFQRSLSQLLSPGEEASVADGVIERAAEQFALELGYRAMGMLATLARPHERVGQHAATEDILRERLAEFNAALGLPAELGMFEEPGPGDLVRLMERQQDPHWFGHPLDRS